MKTTTVLNTLIGVIAATSRRKTIYIRQQALVSQLYPVFSDESFTVSSKIVQEGKIEPPYEDFFTTGAGLLSGGFVKSSTLYYTIPDTDTYGNLAGTILTGGIIKSTAIRYDSSPYDTDTYGDMSSAILAGGIIKTVAIRYNSTTYDTDTYGSMSAMILTGGFVGN